jgi:hypothetical protein
MVGGKGLAMSKGLIMFYIYFIVESIRGKVPRQAPVKIGYSNDPEKRVSELQTGNPRKLKLIISIPFDTEELAREAEQTFQWLAGKKHRRMVGEWFIIYGDWKKFTADALELFDKNQVQKQRVF